MTKIELENEKLRNDLFYKNQQYIVLKNITSELMTTTNRRLYEAYSNLLAKIEYESIATRKP